MAGGGVMHLLNEWAIEILLLVSFSLQLALLLFAGFRRVGASAGLGSWWNRHVNAGSIVISDEVKEHVFGYIQNMLRGVDSMSTTELDAIRTTRGQRALRRHGLHGDLAASLGEEFHQGILTWHVATDIYLAVSGGGDRSSAAIANAGDRAAAARRLAEAVRALSNYMMFLVAIRPDMLPGLVLRRLYQVTCEDMARIWRERKDTHESSSSSSSGRFIDVLSMVWVEMLLYAGNRCSRESHAKQLNSGGELITLVWLLAEHAGLYRINKTKQHFKCAEYATVMV
ncbi:Os04g0156050 [Oryza sativa Japonica Group]|uniref:Os04g0156050 protein n=1 Tax=Oryza sativa subsp. japonica TaxID=39947 RepID=A0A0P0W6T4_ORYSJ|nr:Os04g0156050 [Oryza sativa Japonica Group]